MANRGRILVALFLSCSILPLLASSNFQIPLPTLPDLSKDGDDFARIVKGIEGGESFPGFSNPGLQKPGEQYNEPGKPIGEEPKPEPIPGPGEPQPIPGPGEPQPIQGPGEPQPIPGPGEPQPIPGTGEPQPIPGPGEPQPIPGTGEPQPITGPGEPQPIPGPGEPQPITGPGEPQPIPGTGEPQPIPGTGEPQPKPVALQEGFYQQSCPQAEKIVNEVINKIFQKDPTIAPALVRLFFHDCFVTGCDASILLDRTPSGENVEKNSSQNGKFVRGFEAIDEIKARIEAECPGVVSCADVLAFANRDALVYTGIPSFNVAAGRRDGLASLSKNSELNLPLPESTAKEMTELFQRKGMTLEEMVVLIGAHSIGAAHCTVVAGRFRDPEKSKVIDRGYLTKMQVMTMCQNDTQDLAFDPYSQQKMDSRFYKELLRNRALLESDQNLVLEPNANAVMKKYVGDQKGWLARFTAAITKLGGIEVLTGNQGEIRKQCRFVN